MSTTIPDPEEAIRENIPPEIPSSEVPIGRELGILFGFLFASLVIMAVYTVIWRAIERRVEIQDRLRRESLVAKGVHHGRGGLHEKMLDREVFMGRAELPDHDGDDYPGFDINRDMRMDGTGIGVGIGYGHGHGFGALDGARDGGSRPGSRSQSRTRMGVRDESQTRIGDSTGSRVQSPGVVSRVQSPLGQMRNFSRN
ncbi:uncharacterized protein BDV14DRAFT_153507 [Aspergillus stella-maris]|uniref:uncharacterized protein n=1 Tax=Aspergillus stella-maris TaxID=1810926 RepID=UPI003CCCB7AC